MQVGKLNVHLDGRDSPLVRQVRDALTDSGFQVSATSEAGAVTVKIDDSPDAGVATSADLVICRSWSPTRCKQWIAAGAMDCLPDDPASLIDLPALLRSVRRRQHSVTSDGHASAALATLLDHSGALVGWVDPKLNYRQASAALARFDGRSPSEYAGMAVFEISPWARPAVVTLLKRVLTDREPIVNVDLRFRPNPASIDERTCVAGFYPIVSGGIVAGVGIVLVPAMASPTGDRWPKQPAAAVKSVGVCSAWIDASARLTGGDAAFEKLLGYSADELTTLTLRDLIYPKDLRADTALFDWLGGGVGTFSTEHRWVRKGGSTVPVRMALSRDGNIGPATVAAIDLTDMHRTQELLRRSVADAESAVAAKDRFLAVLSHELRTPLTPVLASVLSIEKDPAFPVELQASFELIRRNVELEARLIDDLLDLTRFSKGNLQLSVETVCLHALLRHTVDLCRHDASTKALHLSISLEAKRHHVRGDPARLKQIFWNLIRNAIKFTPSGGTVLVRTVDGPGGQVHVTVSDTGIGMEPEAVGRVFSAFEQGEKTVSRQFGGLGLGLSISKVLVERHGGSLTVESPGKHRGATFLTMLPTTPPPTADPTPSPTSARKVRVLIVEDHEDTVRAMKRLLERVGYEVNAKSTVRDAIDAVATMPYDVLISDIGLPDGSGMDLVRQLRHTGSTIRAIALSGFGMEDDVRRSKEAGFQEHLTKPVNFARLQQIIAGMTTGS